MLKAYGRLLSVSAKHLKTLLFRDWQAQVFLLITLLGSIAYVLYQNLTAGSSEGAHSFSTAQLSEALGESVVLPLEGAAYAAVKSYFDSYFWLLLLCSASVGFLVVEVFYRSKTAKIFGQLPYSAAVRFFERMTVLLVVALPATVFMLSTLTTTLQVALPNFPGALWLFFYASLASCVMCCAGANAYVGVHYAGPQATNRLGDAYGGPGSALLYAPAIGFGISTLTIFLFKLGTQELLRAGRPTNAFWAAYGIASLVAFATWLAGLRAFREGGDRLMAWFNEYDSVGFQSFTQYQNLPWPDALTWSQRLALWVTGLGRPFDRGVVSSLKRLSIEYRRCYPFDTLTRLLAAAVIIALLASIPKNASFLGGMVIFWLYPTVVESVWGRTIRLEAASSWVLTSSGLENQNLRATQTFFLIRLFGSALLFSTVVVVGSLGWELQPLDEVFLMVSTAFAMVFTALSYGLAVGFALLERHRWILAALTLCEVVLAVYFREAALWCGLGLLIFSIVLWFAMLFNKLVPEPKLHV